jgi:hypothetical protein
MSNSRMGATTPTSRADFTVSLLECRLGVMRTSPELRTLTMFETPAYAKV